MREFWNAVIRFLMGDGLTVARTVALLIFGLLIVKYVLKLFSNGLVKSRVDKTVRSFLISVTGVGLYFVLFLLVGKTAGVSSGTFIAVISAAGLALSLALKDSLSNLANGFIIVGSRPFVVGDYIEVAGTAGSVVSIGIFNTKLATPDNKLITVPNSQIIGGNVVNYSTNATRMIEITPVVPYNTDIAKLRGLLIDIADKQPQALKLPPPSVVVAGLTDKGIKVSFKIWVPKESFWDVMFELNEKIVKAFQAAGISVPADKVEITQVSEGRK